MDDFCDLIEGNVEQLEERITLMEARFDARFQSLQRTIDKQRSSLNYIRNDVTVIKRLLRQLLSQSGAVEEHHDMPCLPLNKKPTKAAPKKSAKDPNKLALCPELGSYRTASYDHSTLPQELCCEGTSLLKSGKDRNKPKRPAGAFFNFMEDFRETYKKEHPKNKSVSAVGKAGGEKWKSMSDSEKAPYVAEAEKRKVEYERYMKAYNKRQAEGPNEDDEDDEEDDDE